MPIGLEELHERMSSLQPRPERNRRQPGDEDDEQRMQGDLAQLAIARAAMAQQLLERAQAHATDEVGVRDHPPVRVAMARPVARPVARVRCQLSTSCRTIRTIESVDQLMANRNGTSIGAKNRLPYR